MSFIYLEISNTIQGRTLYVNAKAEEEKKKKKKPRQNFIIMAGIIEQ